MRKCCSDSSAVAAATDAQRNIAGRDRIVRAGRFQPPDESVDAGTVVQWNHERETAVVFDWEIAAASVAVDLAHFRDRTGGGHADAAAKPRQVLAARVGQRISLDRVRGDGSHRLPQRLIVDRDRLDGEAFHGPAAAQNLGARRRGPRKRTAPLDVAPHKLLREAEFAALPCETNSDMRRERIEDPAALTIGPRNVP